MRTIAGGGFDPAILAGGAAANAFLDSMREVQDDPADALAAHLLDAPDPTDAQTIRTLLQQQAFFTPAGDPSPLLCPEVRQYIEETSALSSWADGSVVKRGEELFNLYGVSSVIILRCASLPECYLMRRGVEVLLSTKYLADEPMRRVLETAHMIMDVMRPGGLMPKSGVGTGVRSAQTVRLLYALIRYRINHGQTAVRWDPGWGKPVNQEDLAYTLMTFSYVMVRGMKTLGAQLTKADEDAYIHCWSVVGDLMGIRQELLPADVTQAKLLFDTIKGRQQGPNDSGRTLTASLIEGLLDPEFSKVIRRAASGVAALVTRKLIGDESADVLGVARPDATARQECKKILADWRDGVVLRNFLYRFPPIRWVAEAIERRALLKMGGIHGDFTITMNAALKACPQIADIVAP